MAELIPDPWSGQRNEHCCHQSWHSSHKGTITEIQLWLECYSHLRAGNACHHVPCKYAWIALVNILCHGLSQIYTLMYFNPAQATGEKGSIEQWNTRFKGLRLQQTILMGTVTTMHYNLETKLKSHPDQDFAQCVTYSIKYGFHIGMKGVLQFSSTPIKTWYIHAKNGDVVDA